MPAGSPRPLIFISYSRKDEPEHAGNGDIQWLSYVRTYLQPLVKHNVVDLFEDRQMPGGVDWDAAIEQKLRECGIFILLVSPNSTASNYIMDKEIAIIRDRQAKGESVHFYPLLITPTPKPGLDKVTDKNLRPRGGKSFLELPTPERAVQMSEVANEIAMLAERRAAPKTEAPEEALAKPAFVHTTSLPETAYERLVGRDAELKRLDESWADPKTNILSLVAEGGTGKSALVNEWLTRLRAESYRAAEAVLGWSFYSQGTKERAASAEEFLNWALDKLGVEPTAMNAIAKAEAIAEAMMQRRILLILDGVEPLQHGPGAQVGQLKDIGLRVLLRRFAATPPGGQHGLVVLTSRLAVRDIKRWQDAAAPVVDVEQLSDEAGAVVLRDNGVWGTDRELKLAARAFAGHPLALNLLAGFLRETQTGDVRRRDRIRNLLADVENPGHDHARRVMESYEREWLARQPILLSIMHMVGLFDRPANADHVSALRRDQLVNGFSESLAELSDESWNRAVARLRDARLLAPAETLMPLALDAHPLLREWFGDRFRQDHPARWQLAHGWLYEFLRDTTKEGDRPSLEQLAPLYQAIRHGCLAGRYHEAFDEVYRERISRRSSSGTLVHYAARTLGAIGSELAALSWFFEEPYVTPVAELSSREKNVVLSLAGNYLTALGRFGDALAAHYRQFSRLEQAIDLSQAGGNGIKRIAHSLEHLSRTELLLGHIAEASATSSRSLQLLDRHADRRSVKGAVATCQATHASVLCASGQTTAAEQLYAEREKRLKRWSAREYFPYMFLDLLLAKGDFGAVRDRTTSALGESQGGGIILITGLFTLALGRAEHGLLLKRAHTLRSSTHACKEVSRVHDLLDEAVDRLRVATNAGEIPRGYLARAAFRRSTGDWAGAAHDLNEIEEIAEPGPMRLFLCDLALERARLALAKMEAFAPLNGFAGEKSPKPELPGEAELKDLKAEAAEHLAVAAAFIEECGYHRRYEELDELRAGRAVTSLPLRV